MFISTVGDDIGALWLTLTYAAKFYIFCLLIGAVYTICLLARTVFRLRVLHRDVEVTDPPRVRSQLIEMSRGIENLRQFNLLLFFLFGVSFANETFATLRAIRSMSLSLSGARIDIFEPLVAFAFLAFVVLALLHTVQWIVAARLQAKLSSISLQHD